MYKEETREYLLKGHNSINTIDTEFTNLKIAIHNLDKLGYNVDILYKQIDNLGIELYKTKEELNKKIKEIC